MEKGILAWSKTGPYICSSIFYPVGVSSFLDERMDYGRGDTATLEVARLECAISQTYTLNVPSSKPL